MDFLSSKYDGIITTVTKLESENSELRSENDKLKDRLYTLEDGIATAEKDMENVKQYLRRDLLEIHGVPESRDEDTNDIVKRVVELMDPEMVLRETDISISHRLPANEGYFPPIIVKFIRRETRDKVYSMKRSLSSKSTLDLGFSQDSQLFINESLTQKCRELLKEVKRFKREKKFKFVWTKQGKILLRKDNTSPFHAFISLNEFEQFRAGYVDQDRAE